MNMPCYFENQIEMKSYRMKIAINEYINANYLKSGTQFKIFCEEPNCIFQITYNRRISYKSKNRYYLVQKGTRL